MIAKHNSTVKCPGCGEAVEREQARVVRGQATWLCPACAVEMVGSASHTMLLCSASHSRPRRRDEPITAGVLFARLRAIRTAQPQATLREIQIRYAERHRADLMADAAKAFDLAKPASRAKYLQSSQRMLFDMLRHARQINTAGMFSNL